MKTSSERLNGLDHLRALAIILVLMYHYRAFSHPDWIDTIGRFGWIGVDLFFVLSGFLISGQLFNNIKFFHNIHLKSFYIKRFFRIIPPYAFTLLLYFGIPFFREREALSPLWKFITFTQNYELDVINKGTFSHAWSLCIEEQFYLVLPFSLLLLIKTKTLPWIKWLVPFLIITSIFCRFIAWNEYIIPHINSNQFWLEWYMKIYYPTYTRLDSLAIGVLISYFFQNSSVFRNFIHLNGNRLFFGGVILLCLSLWLCNDQTSVQASIFGFTAVAISFGIIVLSAVSESSFLSCSYSWITYQLASLSYAIYLSHKGVIHIIQQLLKDSQISASGIFMLLICLAVSILTGLFYRYTIEKPSSRIKNKILNKS
ncbi:acyltransferase family protein [Elizabethkingia anophelis]|uniref:acyltransferase family protein n=1 Tax=Elizabethkingia anophelis TaxID=1117645 RepID=UPI00038A0FB1|nr:acyltransferase [Elizabethkingia anophelis]EJC8058659.1 acyltransferase [Elizabethkingia anophelis]EQB93147.1 acyltransferase [Elizabethkingia anophelis 502]MCL1640573.1 acyltransferase [Elizabethkingia anophelis]MCL1645009.1 acyltransferase [Elizabethkingia anophelis]MCT3735741.1 acyltransferase [Elizabethkingia anophelis]